VAALASAPLEDATPDRDEVQAWVTALPAKEKDDVLTGLVVDGDHGRVTALLRRFLEERAGGAGAVPVARRTVGELRRAAEAYAEERRRDEAEKRAREKARREREAAIAREKYLDGIAGREPALWAKVDTLVATKQPKSTLSREPPRRPPRPDARARAGFGSRLRRSPSRMLAAFIERLRKRGCDGDRPPAGTGQEVASPRP
jgi:hypothetical protein